MAKRNSFKKGTIELLTLAILQAGDCYGYHRVYAINPMVLLRLRKGHYTRSCID